MKMNRKKCPLFYKRASKGEDHDQKVKRGEENFTN